MTKKIGTFDIETDGLLENVTQVWCVVVKDHSDGSVHVWDCNDDGSPTALLDQYDVLIGHNCIAFDFPVLRKIYGWDYAGTKIDTLIMSRTQRPLRQAPRGAGAWPHSVEAWAVRLVNCGRAKVQNDVWDHYHPAILERCQTDVEIQAQIYQALLEEGKGEGWKLAHRLNNKLFDLLQRQEEYGWQVDRDWIDGCLATLTRWINRIDRVVSPHLPLITESGKTNDKPFKKDGTLAKKSMEFWPELDRSLLFGPYSSVSFRPVDLDKNKEVKEFLLKQGWKPKEWNENDDGDRTSPKLSKDDPFEGIQGSLGALIAKRVQCKQRIGILEGWKSSVRDDGRIGAGVAGIATTGRLRHRGIVNVPSPHSGAFFAKQMRAVFTARPGWVLCGVDSKGNQVRQLAARMGDEKFTAAVLKDKERDGEDFHSYNQQLCGGIPRSKAKNFFYGFIFGAGPQTIAKQIGDTSAVAKRLVELYLAKLPKLKALIKLLTYQWKQSNGYIKGIDGRPIHVDTEHKILCYALQSDEAIQMGAAYVKFHDAMAKAGYVVGTDWSPCIWMHDEFQFECRPEIAEAAARIGCDAISWAGRFYGIACPHEGDHKIGRNWSETH